MRTRIGVLLALAAAVGAWGQDDPQPDPEALKAVREAFEAGSSAAQARVREAKTAIAAELREDSERDARFDQALKDLTKRSPLRLKLSDTLTLDQVRVTGYYAGRVTLAWPQGEVEYPLELLPEETRATLVGAALTKAGPRDHFEMGKLLVRGKDFERAARCFDTAQRDPALAPFIPDLERLKRSARLFEGSFRTAGNTLSLRWGFSSAAEAGDFAAIQGSVGVRPGQGLEVDGEKIAVAAVKEIPFRNRIRVSALPKESDAVAHLMGIRFLKPDGGDVLIYGALATAAKTFLVTKVEDGKAQELQAPTPGAAGNRMTMEFNRGRVVFQVGDRTVWSGNEGGFTDVLVVLGCVALPKPGAVSRASGVFRDLSLQGEVNPAWMTKKMSGLRSAMASELSKEHRAKRTEGAAGTLTLSVDPILARVPAEVRDAYKAALSKVATMRQSRLQEDFDAARLAMDQLSGANPTFAPAWYWRGLLADSDGNLRAASGYFDRALALLPDFPEALCARGRIRVLEGKWDPARESVERALALKPDLAEGHLLRARLQWEKRESGAVIDSTELARRLAPLDPDIDSDAKMLANVARGPRWPKPNSHATAHYAVRSDLPAAKCRLYAENLEAIRPHYAEVLGRAAPEGKPAEVLIFESEEGYFIYNDYTVGSRGEHTLGAFSPWHGQMALFEGLEAPDTLNVLSHEGFHQYLHGLAPDVPIWFNEGMAEYVGAARVENGKIVERGGIQAGRLDNLKLAVKYGWRPLPFDKIMLESQAEFYGPQAPFKYAQAWSMIRYFKDGDSGRWSGVLKAYTDRLLAGDSALAAFEASFAKEDLKALEAAWMKHYGLVLTVRPAGKGSAPPAPTSVDLLALIGATRPQGQGWTLKDGALNSAPVQPGGAIDLGYVPPEEYEWRLTLTRFYGQGGLALGLQGGGKTFVVKLDDWGVGSGLEAVDGAAGRNPTFVRGRRLLLPGQTASVVCTVRRTGVGVTLNDEVVLDWKGDLGRLSYAPGPGMPAATKNLFLGAFGDHFKVSAMSVKAVSSDPTAPAVTPSAPTIKVDRARAIALDCDIVQWIVDEDSRQILALDPSGKLLQVSMAEMKVLRKISVGSDAVALCAAPGNAKAVWVSSKKGQNLLKVDLEKGDVADAIPVPVPPGAVLGIRKYLFYMDTELPGVCAVDTSDKKDLGRLTGEAFFAMAYEPRKDRLWVTAGGSLVEYDGSKIGAVLRELSRKNLGAKERQDLTAELSPGLNNKGTITKRHFVTGTDGRTTWSRVQWDEKGGRLYFGTFAAKSDKPETPLGSYVAKPHSLEKDPAIAQFIAKARPTEQILAVSPDGKWVATGAHLFGAASFQVSRELPLPTSLVAFSKDSKEVCYYDWVNRVIAVMDVEAK